MENKSLLTLKNLTVSVNDKVILQDINFEFEKGKIYAVMGPNGSGKSTLAYALMGHPAYKVGKRSQMIYQGKNIGDFTADKRAEKGMFLSFQSPLSLAGVKVYQMLQYALMGKKDPLKIREETNKYASDLKIREDLLSRSLNEGASGGEKKKLEVLQAAVLDREFVIFDEVDTGVDVDSLKTIAEFLNKNKKDKTYIVITHYNRILKYLKPDKVIVIKGGKIEKVGDYLLAEEIEKRGYE